MMLKTYKKKAKKKEFFFFEEAMAMAMNLIAALLRDSATTRLIADILGGTLSVGEKTFQKAISGITKPMSPPGLGKGECVKAQNIPLKTLKSQCSWSSDAFSPRFCTVLNPKDPKDPNDPKLVAFLNELITKTDKQLCQDVSKQGQAYFVYPYLNQDPKNLYRVPIQEGVILLKKIIQRREEEKKKRKKDEDLIRILAAFIYNARLRNEMNKIYAIRSNQEGISKGKNIYLVAPFQSKKDFEKYKTSLR